MRIFGFFPLVFALGLPACASVEEASDPSDPEVGRALYQEKCAACHGEAGAGNGPAAAALNPNPSDLTGLAQRQGGYDKDYVMSVIYAAPDQQGAAMPAFGHGHLGDLVIVEEAGLGTPVYTDLLALATYIETLQK